MYKNNVIVCSAQINLLSDIIASPRHWSLMPKLIPFLKPNWNPEELDNSCFGFLDKSGVFLSRKDAYVIAKNNNQILHKNTHENLISEQLYLDTGDPIIVCAANYHKELDIMICGIRHYDTIMRNTIKQFKEEYIKIWGSHGLVIQGFTDQYDIFYTREDALQIALKNNQRKYRCGGDENQLFSENLY